MFCCHEHRSAERAVEFPLKPWTTRPPPHGVRAIVAARSLVRILIYDQHCRGPGKSRWLSRSFRAGASLFGGARFFDAVIPSTSWAQALRETLRVAHHQSIDEIQVWGHGKWGRALIGDDTLDASALSQPGELAASLRALGRH